MVDYNGNIVNEYSYDPWGKITSETETVDNPIKYAGEYYDDESGLIYLRNRYYNPSIGRFISEDPARDELNWYAYCGNNPVMFVDPSGEIPVLVITVAGGAIIGSVVSAGSNVVSQWISNGWDNINWKEVGVNAAGGAISGALAGTGAPTSVIVLGNALIGGGTYIGTQKVNNESIDYKDLMLNVGYGAFIGKLGGSDSTTIQQLSGLQSAFYKAKFLGLQSGQEINKQLFREIAVNSTIKSFFHGIRDEFITNIGENLLSVGSVGDNVKYLQSVLGVKQDGIFGINTKNALKELQTKLGVTADGIYGNETKTALYELFK